jgi:hypothetical protein
MALADIACEGLAVTGTWKQCKENTFKLLKAEFKSVSTADDDKLPS